MDLKHSCVQSHKEHDKMQIVGPQHGGWYEDFCISKISLDHVAGFEGYIFGLTDLEQQSLFIVEIWLYEIVNRVPF